MLGLGERQVAYRADEPGPHVWSERAVAPSGRCDGLTCTETVDFSDIRNNYTAQMLMWRPVAKGDYWAE